MAAPDISGLLQAAPIVLNEMPQVISGLQIVFYIVLILGAGSIIMIGYRGYMHSLLKLLARIGLGFVALVAAIGISNSIPLFIDSGFFIMIQKLLLNPIIGIIISTPVLTICMYLISHNIFNIPGIKKQIEKLQSMLKHAEEVTIKEAKKLEPVRIVGIIILVVFLAFALINFQGFPSMSDELFSFIGLTPEDIQELNQYMENIEGFNGNTPDTT
jgi:hypothetical protein